MSTAVPSLKQSLGAIIGRRFPWLLHVVTVAGAKGKGLAFRTASGLLHLAGGPDDPAVVRVGDAGTGGTFAAGIAPVTMTYTDPAGVVTSFTMSVGASPVAVVIGGPGLGAVTTKNTEGSDKVTCA